MIIYHERLRCPRGREYIIRDINPCVDAKAYHGYIRDENVIKWMDIKPCITLKTAQRDLENFSSFDEDTEGKCLGIARLRDNELIGTMGFNYLDSNRRVVELVTDLNFKYFGLGIMYFCLIWMKDYCFNTRGIFELRATILKGNMRAINMARRLQFQRLSENNTKLVYNLTNPKETN